MKVNNKSDKKLTHEGGVAKRITPYQELRRTVMSCLLWEDTFYESGQDIAERINDLVKKNKPEDVSKLAVEARTEYRLRHTPLLLAREMVRNFKGKIVGETVTNVIQRADELAEILAIYWLDGKQPLSAQLKKGLAKAWPKFSEYHLAKYNRDGQVKLKDSLFLCHAKPKDEQQEAVWKKLINGTLPPPDTWEVNLSAGKDKKETFTRLIEDKKLGYMALLRNLRNMTEVNVDKQLISRALIDGAEKSKALPFRYVAAAKACPQLEPVIDEAMQIALKNQEKLPGITHIIVDVSSSMGATLSKKGTLSRVEAAAALAAMLSGICEDLRVFVFGTTWTEIPPRKGMALVDKIKNTDVGWNTQLGKTVREIQNKHKCDRMICITDEQTRDSVPDPEGTGYIINVASYKNGVGYGKWTHIDGFSEAVIQYIREIEK